MANLNKVLLMGNITRDPELSFLPSQTPVCKFGLAVNRSWTGQDGVKKEETTFVDCNCFGKVAELIAKYKKKGDPLFVEGRLKLDQWEAQDGSKRSRMFVIVENFQFLNRSQNAGQGGYGGGNSGGGGNEYGGEPEHPPAGARQPYRQQAGRPMAGGQGAPQRPQPAPPQFDPGDAPDAMPDDGPPSLTSDDIPF